MKRCPICQLHNCQHLKKFFGFGLLKIRLIEDSLLATISLFNKLSLFLPVPSSMQYKISLTSEDLNKCKDRIAEIKTYYKSQIVKDA